jgi:polyphenol oxidase
MVGAAVAVPALFGAGAAFAQDNPVDCAPIGVAGKTPVPYKPDPTLPVRMRKSAFELNKTEVDRLKSAYDALRKLTKNQPNDPRGWLRQGFVHCWYCGGGSDGKAGAEIHGSWFFFPWHRAYLHFHERILCKLIGDDTFALPYWDWDSQGRQTFPSVYGDPNDRSNPLFDMLRSAKPNAQISRQAVSVGILNRTMNQPRNTLFMGSQNDSGAMENAPHGPVHIWTGDTAMQSVRNDMGVLATAAQDPVFFAHHDNIDRLWSVWLGLAPTHQNFTATAWLNHGWDFYDENSVWTHIKISDVLDQVKSLRSDYAKPSVNPIWKFTPRKPASALVAAAPAEKLAPLVFAAPSAAPTALGTAPITRDITLPQPHAQAFAALSAEAPAQFVLNVRGISVPSDQQAMFNVFLNLPDATPATSTDVPNFVGMVTVLAKSKEGGAHQHAETNAAFDVSDVLGQVKDGGKLAVTLVPVAGEGAPSQDSQATFRQVSIDQL